MTAQVSSGRPAPAAVLTARFVDGNDISDLADIATEPIETLVVMPYIDRAQAERSARQLAARAGVAGLLLAVEDRERHGFIRVVNRVYRQTRGEYVAYVAQDAFAGRQWLKQAHDALRKNGKGLLGFNDGKWSGALAAFGLVRRSWADGNYGGDLFHAGYRRHYADVELTVLAINDAQYCYNANAVLIEVDWEKERAPVHAPDQQLYRQRASAHLDNRVHRPELLALFS